MKGKQKMTSNQEKSIKAFTYSYHSLSEKPERNKKDLFHHQPRKLVTYCRRVLLDRTHIVSKT